MQAARCGWVALLLVVGVSLGLSAAATDESVVVAIDADLITDILDAMEIEYDTWLDAYGDPVWAFTYRGILTTLVVYDKTASGGYGSLLLYAGWSTTDTTSLETINAWNCASRFGRAYADETGDPVIELDLLVAAGVTVATIRAYIQVFAEAATTLGMALQL